MNGAAESLLEDILKQANITNANLAAMLKQSAGNTTGGAGGGVQGFTKSLNIASIAVTAVYTAANLLSTAFSYLGNVVGATAGQMYAFGKAAAEGTATLSQLYRVFDQLPIIGRVFSLFADLVQYQEELLKGYQQLTQSGASFSGSLYQMRQMAYSAYMTLAEFGKVVNENSSLFSSSIGGVDAGLKTFTATQAKLMDPNGDFGRNLLGLGVTAEQAGDMLATYMKLQGNMSKVNRQSTDEIAASTNGLIIQLDQYAKLTGENREDLAKKMKEKALDEQLNMFLSGLNGPERAQAEQALVLAAQQGGKGLQDEVAVRIMSNGQIKTAGTEAANQLRITTKNSSAMSADLLASMVKMKPGSDEFLSTMQSARNGIAKGTSEFNSALGGPGRAGIISFFGGVKFANEQARTANRATMSDAEKDAEVRANILAKQQEQYKGSAAALAAAEMQIKMFGASLGSTFLALLGKFQPAIDKISNLLLKGFSSAVTSLIADGGPLDKLGQMIEDYFVPMVEKVVSWFESTMTYLGSSEDMKTFWTRLGEKLKEAGAVVWEYIKPPLVAMWQEIKPVIVEMFKGLFDAMKSALIGTEIKDAKTQALYERQNEINKSVMTVGERISTFMAEGLEGFAGLFSDSFAKRIAADRIESDTQFGIGDKRLDAKTQVVLPQRKTGSLGMTGSLFENWGSGTPAMLHGNEAVVTPDQMNSIVNNSMVGELQTLNRVVADLLKYNKETADYARRNVDATKSLNGNLFAT